MRDVGNSFTYPLRYPGWFGRFALVGLVNLIPILGQIWVQGGMLETVDNLRAGRGDLAEVRAAQIGRGVQSWAALLVYRLVAGLLIGGPIVLIVLAAIGSSAASAAVSHNSSDSAPASAVLFPLFAAYGGAITVVGLATYLVQVPVIVAVERGGIGAGLNPQLVWGLIRQRGSNAVLAAILTYVAFLIGGFGIYACCIGLLISLPYAYAVLAGIVFSFERSLEEAPTVG